jgi:hypothetical protein
MENQMFRMTTFLAAPAFALLMSGTAHAALTADQVWQSWKDAGALAGLTVSAATENNDGGELTLNGVSIAPAGMAGMTISDMVLTEQDDGSVTITPGTDIGIDLTGEGTTGAVKLTHDGLELTAREGDGGALVYDYAAAALDVTFDSAYPATSFDGTDAGEATMKGAVGFAGLSGSYSDTPGTNRSFGLDIMADTLTYDVGSDDPGLQMKTTSVSETADVEMSFDVAMPSTMSLLAMTALADFGTALQEGLSVTVSTKQGTSIGSASQEDQFFPYQMAINAGPGKATGVFNKDTFNIKSSGDGLSLEMTSTAMPVPVKINSGPVEVGMTFPVIAPDTAGDFGLIFKLSQFTVNEEAWAMVDPGGALKRDPADLSIDVSGKTTFDFVGLMQAEETGVAPPIPAPESLNITDVTLKLAGAAFAATGAFTFGRGECHPDGWQRADRRADRDRHRHRRRCNGRAHDDGCIHVARRRRR